MEGRWGRLAHAPAAVVAGHGDDDFFVGAVGEAEDEEDGGVVSEGVVTGTADADVADAAVGTLLLGHKLAVAREQLLAVVVGKAVGPCPTLKELLVLARHQVAVVALGGQRGQLLGGW